MDRDSPYKKTRKGVLKLKPEYSPPKKQADSKKSPSLSRTGGRTTKSTKDVPGPNRSCETTADVGIPRRVKTSCGGTGASDVEIASPLQVDIVVGSDIDTDYQQEAALGLEIETSGRENEAVDSEVDTSVPNNVASKVHAAVKNTASTGAVFESTVEAEKNGSTSGTEGVNDAITNTCSRTVVAADNAVPSDAREVVDCTNPLDAPCDAVHPVHTPAPATDVRTPAQIARDKRLAKKATSSTKPRTDAVDTGVDAAGGTTDRLHPSALTVSTTSTHANELGVTEAVVSSMQMAASSAAAEMAAVLSDVQGHGDQARVDTVRPVCEDDISPNIVHEVQDPDGMLAAPDMSEEPAEISEGPDDMSEEPDDISEEPDEISPVETANDTASISAADHVVSCERVDPVGRANEQQLNIVASNVLRYPMLIQTAI